jgi:hypothetical protein
MGEEGVRLLGLLLFIAGLALSFAPAATFSQFLGREIARETVFEDGAFREAVVDLNPALAPAAFRLRIEEDGRYDPASGQAALAVVISHSGQSGFAAPVIPTERDRAPEAVQSGAVVYDVAVTRFSELVSGPYRFTVSEGDADEIGLTRVDLVVQANAFVEPPDFAFYGNVALWLGAALFFIGLRRRNRNRAANPSEPPAPKWGRQ